eukprot:Hpha_TRINITY_DN7505_c0_g1::TRINITY_DN7505_c0_g1_i1::g.19063::m.19063/K15258/PARP6_8; poly [ADP-ribose] polymerase 6/8
MTDSEPSEEDVEEMLEDDEEEEYVSDGGSLSGTHSEDFRELQLLQLEVQLLRMHGFRAGYLSTGLTVMVAFGTDFLSEQQRRVCGLHFGKDIVFTLTFPSSPPTYLASSPGRPDGPERVTVRQSSDACLDNKQTLADAAEFGLWWTLEQVLHSWLRHNWAVLERACRVEIERADERNKTMRWGQVQRVLSLASETQADVDLRLATEIVARTGGRLEASQELMYDEEARESIRKSARKWYFDESSWDDFSLLLRCVKFLKSRIREASSRCIVCDQPHPLPLVKPVACDNNLCNFQMVNLGLGVSLEMEIIHFPNVVDFLMCCASAAADSQNKYTHFPYEAKQVSKALTVCPPVEEMRQVVLEGRDGKEGKEALKHFLAEKHREPDEPFVLYNILRWIVASNRTHIEEVPTSQTVHGMPVSQFLLSSTTPQKEHQFQGEKRSAGGSFFAFHGSPLGSWHNILRGGLKNLEIRTAFGPGIYFATNASTSLGYMSAASGFPQSRFGTSLRIMALCEIVAEGDEKKCKGRVHRAKCSHNTNSPHIRVEAEECVVTRLIFLFTDTSNNYNIDARKLEQDARKILSDFGSRDFGS